MVSPRGLIQEFGKPGKAGGGRAAALALELAARWQEAPPGWVQDVREGWAVLDGLTPWSLEWTRGVRRVLVLGTGGSALGGKALVHALGQPHGCAVVFADNLDPVSLDRMLEGMDPEQTRVAVISKSGRTVETMVQLMACQARYRSAVPDAAVHPLARCGVLVTDPGASPLREWAEAHGMPVMDHPARTGGRYAVFSRVGLLPALCAGAEARRFLEGARSALESFAGAPDLHPATEGAAWVHHQGRPQHVMMPYTDRLVPWAFWHRQLWAESLGKEGKGVTPVCALGPADQHSQLQLYLDGPDERSFTFLPPSGAAGSGYAVQPLSSGQQGASPAWGELEGKTVLQVLQAQYKATRLSLEERGRPVRVWDLQPDDAFALGSAMVHAMIEVVLLAAMTGINPWDQPAVEAIKNHTRRYLEAG